jgi:hypothetical protein
MYQLKAPPLFLEAYVSWSHGERLIKINNHKFLNQIKKEKNTSLQLKLLFLINFFLYKHMIFFIRIIVFLIRNLSLSKKQV